MEPLQIPEDYVSSANRRSFFLKSLNQWDDHNSEVLRGNVIDVTNEESAITKSCIERVNRISSNNFKESTDQLEHRSRHIHHWKCELEHSIREINTEIKMLEETRQRLKRAMGVIKIPEAIVEECLDIRHLRMESDMICDIPYEALVLESALIKEIIAVYNRLLIEIENQHRMNCSAKETLESDWSNKEIAYKTEVYNSDLKSKSLNVRKVPGVTRLAQGQSNISSWESFTKSSLDQYQNALDKSKKLREKTDGILINAARDIRSQDAKVNKALAERIANTQEMKLKLEQQLITTLEKIVEVERTVEILMVEAQKINQKLRVAQSRLFAKNSRPDVENCREGSLHVLIEEVRDLNECFSLIDERKNKSLQLRAELMQERSQLENEIIVKSKTIHLDNDRCLAVQSHYVSAEKLCGY